MKIRFQNIRKGLENNKIFFEVIVASSLSFMAIYVSIQANRIAENQTKIMRDENLPQLEVRFTQEYNDQLKIYDNDIWLFFNRGGKLSNFDTKEYSFYKFTYHPNYDSLLLPVYNYLPMRGILTGDIEGLIYQIDNNRQGAKIIELRDSLANFGYYDIESYVSISYEDIFDERHEEYFQISPSVNRISLQDWKKIETNFNNAKPKYMFPKLSAKSIIETIKTRTKQ